MATRKSSDKRPAFLSRSGSHLPIPEPTFMLQRGSTITLGGDDYEVERRRQDGRWQLVSGEGTLLLQTDRDLAERLKRGELCLSHERGMKIFAPPPLSPLVVSEKAHAANLRKFSYVKAMVGPCQSQSYSAAQNGERGQTQLPRQFAQGDCVIWAAHPGAQAVATVDSVLLSYPAHRFADDRPQRRRRRRL